MSDKDNWVLPSGIWFPNIESEQEAIGLLFTPKCECGTKITMGKDDAPEFHSDFCPVYKRWIQEYGKKG